MICRPYNFRAGGRFTFSPLQLSRWWAIHIFAPTTFALAGESQNRPYNLCVPAGDSIGRPYNFRPIRILLFQAAVIPDGQLAQAFANMKGGRLQSGADRVRLQHMHVGGSFFFRQRIASH